MTNEDFHALARRLVACPHFRWLPGMLARCGLRVLSVDADNHVVGISTPNGHHKAVVDGNDTPDLSDTLTCLGVLHLVREAWRAPGATTYLLEGDAASDGWRVSLGHREPFQRDGFATEAEALVVALEAAPAR